MTDTADSQSPQGSLQGVPQRPAAPAYPTQRPIGAGPTAWRAYWASVGQPWRREPEIDAERQAYLAERRAGEVNVEQRRYPMGGLALTRADVEWLLATHEDGNGPLDWSVETQRKRPGVDLRAADLRGADLAELPLAGAWLSLTETQFFSVTSQTERYELLEASGALAQNATLRGADLRGASLQCAHLEGADLRDARCEGTNLTRAHCDHADLRGVTFDTRTGIGQAHLEYANLTGVDLRLPVITYVTVEGASLAEVDFTGADLSANRFREANLRGAKLDGANLSGVTFWGADLTGASLRGANLREARLQRDAGWSVLQQSEATLRNVLDGADLTGAILDKADLTGASLVGAILDDASCLETRLGGVNLERASLAGATLTQARCDGATNLKDAVLSTRDRTQPTSEKAVIIFGVHWNGANVAAARWSQITRLGDEITALKRARADGEPKSRATQLAELEIAVRAYRQLSNALDARGQGSVAGRFAYRGEVVQRAILWRQLTQEGKSEKFGPYLFSLFLGTLTGYGHRMGRILIAYLVVIALAAGAYYWLGLSSAPHLGVAQALLVSLTAFHGRVFSEQFVADSPQTWVTAIEAICGLVVEGVFIAMLTQRFFGK